MPLKGEFQKIYVRAPNWVGDCVAATAVFRELRDTYPQAEIHIAVRPHLEPLLRGGPWANRLLAAEGHGGWGEIRQKSREMQKENYDLALLLPNTFRSALAPYLARIPQRVGYAMGGRSFLLTRGLRPLREGFRRIHVPMPYYYSSLAALVGVNSRSIRPELFYDEKTGKEAEQFLKSKGIASAEPFVLINPGAAFGSSKLWDVGYFAQLVDRIHEKYGMKSLIHCGPGEEPIAKEIEARAQHKPVSTYDSRRGLHELKPIVDRCALMITTDSGPRHYGVAFDKPIVCIMGPTHPQCTHANVEKTEVVRLEVECGPCHLKVCPFEHHKCMKEITPQMVMEAVGRLVQKGLRGQI